MTDKDLTGKVLERLVATLERVLANANAKIEAPSRRLIDRDTGKTREHDVLITWDHGHHQIITAIECRDRSRPVGVPDVEAFADKCASTGVSTGVIVSATGFRKSALVKAAARSITCMDLTEVDNFAWLHPDFEAVTHARQFGDISIEVIFKDAKPNVCGIFIDAQGNEFPSENFINLVCQSLHQLEFSEENNSEPYAIRIPMRTEGWAMRDNDGKIWPINYIIVDTKVLIKRTVSSARKIRYTGGGKDYSLATIDTQLGDVSGNVVLVRNDDGSTSVYLSFDGSKQIAG